MMLEMFLLISLFKISMPEGIALGLQDKQIPWLPVTSKHDLILKGLTLLCIVEITDTWQFYFEDVKN